MAITNNNTKPILLTGGLGFVGYHVCRRLLNEGHTILNIDAISNFTKVSRKEQLNQTLFKEFPDTYLFLHLRLSSAVSTEELISHVKRTFGTELPHFHKIIHLAAQPGVRYSIAHTTETFSANIDATILLLEFCRHLEYVPHIVIASSSSVYGSVKQINGTEIAPFAEYITNTDYPVSPYAASKKACEVIAHSYCHLFNWPISMIRFFTVYGPGGREDMAIGKFIWRIVTEESPNIDVLGTGEQEREFTYIDDIVDGVVSAMNLHEEGQNDKLFQIFNLGGGHVYTLNHVISSIEEEYFKVTNENKKFIRNQLPAEKGDVPVTIADLSNSEKVLNYSPKVSLSTGISNAIKFALREKNDL